LLFIYLLLRAGHPGRLPADLFFLLDPVVGLAGALAARHTMLGMALGAAVALLAAVLLGRVWCGWICPLGAVLDCTPSRKVRPGQAAEPAPAWRRVKFLLLAAILVAALLGNLTLLFLDPITLLYRTVTTVLWPALIVLISGLEGVAYGLPVLHGPVDLIEAGLRGAVLPTYQPLYRAGIPIALLFVGVLALNAVAARFWCRYLCPLGGLLGLISRVAWLQREVGETCASCQRCSRACPMGTIDASRGYASDPAECTLCLDCVDSCAKAGQTFRFGGRPATAHPYDPTRRQFVAAAAAAVAMVGMLGSEPASAHDDPRLIRPPGAQGPDFLRYCIRCGACLKACPTSGLQPGQGEAGWTGLWTPVLVPRLGYCDYGCNACGQVCPTGAIQPLALSDKQKQVIGLAYIDENRCIPWTDNRNCIVCEEMCPLSEKAILLEDVEVTAPDGTTGQVRRPHVIRERCIGCGICENHCPLKGAAAITVYAPTDLTTVF
jgi:MauM/NapG family ferredoxin protein